MTKKLPKLVDDDALKYRHHRLINLPLPIIGQYTIYWLFLINLLICINMSHKHVTSACRAIWNHPKNIKCLIAFLAQTPFNMVYTLVISHISYCKAIIGRISL